MCQNTKGGPADLLEAHNADHAQGMLGV